MFLLHDLNIILNPEIQEHFSIDGEQKLYYVCVIVYSETSASPLSALSLMTHYSEVICTWAGADVLHVPGWHDAGQSFHIRSVSLYQLH